MFVPVCIECTNFFQICQCRPTINTIQIVDALNFIPLQLYLFGQEMLDALQINFWCKKNGNIFRGWITKCSSKIKQMTKSQLCSNIQFSTCSVNTQQNQITYSKVLNSNPPLFQVHSIPKKHHCNKTLNVLEFYTVFGQPEQPLSLLQQEFVAMI